MPTLRNNQTPSAKPPGRQPPHPPILPEASINLIYIDPPFNTGKIQTRHRITTAQNAEGDRTGFVGRRYRTINLGSTGYLDFFSDYLDFLPPASGKLTASSPHPDPSSSNTAFGTPSSKPAIT